MRILAIAPVALTEAELAARAEQSAQFGATTGVEVDFRAVEVGPRQYDTHQDWLLAEFGILQAGANAQTEGYDAVCVDTLSDAGVNALRSVCDVPVVGAGQAAYLMATALGRRFSVLTQWSPWFPLYERGLREYGLRDSCVSMRSVDTQPDLQNLLAGKESLFPRFVACARECIADGADVIVLGSTTMHALHGYLVDRLQVPVVDPGPASYALALSLHALKAEGHSRLAYTRGAPETSLLAAMTRAGRRERDEAPPRGQEK